MDKLRTDNSHIDIPERMNLSQAAVDQWLNWPPEYWPYQTKYASPYLYARGTVGTSIPISTLFAHANIGSWFGRHSCHVCVHAWWV
jgi:hypothetical protein